MSEIHTMGKDKGINNYDDELNRIVMSIFGLSEKLPLGSPPAYIKTIIDAISGLTVIDNIVLKLSCEEAAAIGSLHNVNATIIRDKIKLLEVPENEYFESLEILDSRGYIKTTKVFGRAIPYFSITSYGFSEYAKVYIKGYDSIMENVISQIVNHHNKNNLLISESIKQPKMIVDHILDILNNKGLIGVTKTLGGDVQVFKVSSELTRRLR